MNYDDEDGNGKKFTWSRRAGRTSLPQFLPFPQFFFLFLLPLSFQKQKAINLQVLFSRFLKLYQLEKA